MATVTKVANGKQQKELDKALASGKQTLAGGLVLPEGTHQLAVADENAFGLLNVTRTSDKKEFALPIVAGVITIYDGDKPTKTKITTEISDKAGAKTLVVPDNFFVQMKPDTNYSIKVELRNGRKVVTDVVPADVTEEVED